MTAASPGPPGAGAAPGTCPVTGQGPDPSAIPLMGPRFQTDPAQLYREMHQQHGPVAPVLLLGDFPAWLVIGYREMHQVCSDPELFPRDTGLWNQRPNLPPDWPLHPMVGHRQPSVYFTVGEEHRRHLRMLESALEEISPFELRQHTEELADRLIDSFSQRGEADLVASYARPLTVLVLSRLLGFRDSEGAEMIRAMTALADGAPDANESQAYANSRVYRLFEEKSRAPGADMASHMLAYPEPFTSEEYALDAMATLAAGFLPTSDWIGNSVRLMLTDDRFSASLAGGRHSIGEAMNEVLWEDTPTQILAGRWAARDTRLGGQHIQSGDMLLLGLAAANGDPEVHDAATGPGDGFRQGNNAHFAFGHGEYQCPFPAREVAEILARTAIEVLLDRLPDVDLAVPAASLTRRPSPFLRGMTVLPVEFAPTPAVGGHR